MAAAPSELGIRPASLNDHNGHKYSFIPEFIPFRPSNFLELHPVYNGEGVPKGDGHPVMPVPGFGGSDLHMTEMRNWLDRMDYTSVASGISINVSPRRHILKMQSRLEEEVKRTGERATLIGWSLGGIYALGLGMVRPDLVQRVVTMGTPLNRDIREAVHPFLRIIGITIIEIDETLDRLLKALPEASFPSEVSLISIYSRSDEMIDWKACIDKRAQANIEVQSTHFDYPRTPEVYKHLGNILAGQPVLMRTL